MSTVGRVLSRGVLGGGGGGGGASSPKISKTT